MNHEKYYVNWEWLWADFEDWFDDTDHEPDWFEQKEKIQELVSEYMRTK